jgi:hypothetical protein
MRERLACSGCSPNAKFPFSSSERLLRAKPERRAFWEFPLPTGKNHFLENNSFKAWRVNVLERVQPGFVDVSLNEARTRFCTPVAHCLM